VGLQSGKGVPFQFLEMKICEKFGWTLQELYSQPWSKIDFFLKAMSIEAQFQERKMKKYG